MNQKTEIHRKVIKTPAGQLFLMANGTNAVCPFSQPEQHVAPPKMAGLPPEIKIVRPQCGSWCPLFECHPHTSAEKTAEQTHIVSMSCGTREAVHLCEFEELPKEEKKDVGRIIGRKFGEA